LKPDNIKSLIQYSPDFNWTTQIVEHVITVNLLQRFFSPEHLFPLGYVLPRTRTCIFKECWQISLEECGATLVNKATIKFTTDQHFRRK
jgi:hypothetical protein